MIRSCVSLEGGGHGVSLYLVYGMCVVAAACTFSVHVFRAASISFIVARDMSSVCMLSRGSFLKFVQLVLCGAGLGVMGMRRGDVEMSMISPP